MISCSNIHKQFGGLQILKGIDLSVAQGELVSIVGASGAGKSTLLHILGTLETSNQGSVVVDGQIVGDLGGAKLAKFRNEKIGFVFQFHHLLPEFSALENVLIPAFIKGTKTEIAQKKARELLGLMGLENRFDHKPHALSGGEQQRVAVARALINSPKVIFADEPSGNLDSKNAKDLHQMFVMLKNTLACTFVVVTHNEQLALLSDRTVVMKDGKIV